MKNNLKTNKKKTQMWFWELKFVLTKKTKHKKTKHVFCKHDFCFKLKNKKKTGMK